MIAIVKSMAEMAGASGEVFGHLRARAPVPAMQAMVRADQQYGRLTSAMRDMRGDAVSLQARVIDQQEREAEERRWYELVIGMQPTSNAAPRDAAPAECNKTSETRH
jgi:hypothetical protein